MDPSASAKPPRRGRKISVDLREMLNAIHQPVRHQCQRRLPPFAALRVGIPAARAGLAAAETAIGLLAAARTRKTRGPALLFRGGKLAVRVQFTVGW